MDCTRTTTGTGRLLKVALARALLCLFVAGILRLNAGLGGAPEALLPYGVVALGLLSVVAFLGLALAGVPERPLVGASVWLDVMLVSVLVYLTGGVGSDFLLLFFGPVLAAAVFFHRGVAVVVASLATMGLFFSAWIYALSPEGPPLVAQSRIAGGLPEAGPLVGVLALQATAFHLVAFLASALTLRLRSANIRTEQIVENMSDGVVTVTRAGRIMFLNARAAEMLRLGEKSDFLGAPLSQVLPAPAVDAFREVMGGRQPATLEVELGPESAVAEVTVLPVPDQSGRLRGANVILHDLTERRKLTEALRRADRLEATATTVASIAHEIRNPLAAIRGSVQELQSELGPSDGNARLMNLVVSESDRLNRVLTEFLHFGRMPRPRPAPCELRRLLEEVAEEVRMSPAAEEPEITVEGSGSLTIEADAGQLREVFLNLSTHALEATGGRGPIRLRLEEGEAGTIVETLDSGCGVKESIRESIFEPFFTTKTTGTGLGLSIAARVVEDHGGTLELGEAEDGWTNVRVFIPRAKGGAVSGD